MKPFDPRLLRAAPAIRRPVAALAVVGVLQGLLTIALAFAISAVIVAVVEGSPLGSPLGWTAGLFAARALLSWTAERVAAWVGVEVTTTLRRALLAHWLTQPAERRPAPETATTLAAQGTSTIEPYAARFLPALVSAAVVPAFAIAALIWVDWVSALIVVATLPLLPFFAALIGKTTQADTDKRWAALSSLAGHFLDVMRGLPTLVNYGRAERQVDVIREVSERHRHATMRTLRLAFMSSAALELLASLSVAIVAVTVGLRLTWGSMPLYAGLVAILLSPEAYWPIRRVGAEFHSAADGAEAIKAVLAELDPPSPAAAARTSANRTSSPEHMLHPAPTTPTSAHRGSCTELGVEVRDLTHAYAGEPVPVIAHLSLSAGPGLTVITGQSGVGKTTLLELIAGLREPLSGEIRSGATHLVTQRPFLSAGTIRDALTLGQSATDAELWTALRQVALDGFVAGLPESLSTGLGDDGFGLSAGQRARLAIARSLLSAAPVTLLDEPTAHLDEAATTAVHDVIVELSTRHTVIAVTHRADLVALADQHIHLERQQAAVTP